MHTEWRTRRRRVRHINKSFLDFSSRLNLTNAYLTPQHTLYKLTAARTAPKSAHSRHTAPLCAGTTTPSRDPQIIEFPPNFDHTRAHHNSSIPSRPLHIDRLDHPRDPHAQPSASPRLTPITSPPLTQTPLRATGADYLKRKHVFHFPPLPTHSPHPTPKLSTHLTP